MSDVVLSKNINKPDEPHVSMVPSADLEAIEHDLNTRHETHSSRHRPSPVLRPKTTQDATSNRITLDF